MIANVHAQVILDFEESLAVESHPAHTIGLFRVAQPDLGVGGKVLEFTDPRDGRRSVRARVEGQVWLSWRPTRVVHVVDL